MRLKQQLKQGDETLFQQIFLAHFESCHHYLRQQYKLSYEKSYDVVMDTLLAFRRKLLEDKIKYGNLRFLFTQMASHIYLKEVTRAPTKAIKQEVQALLQETPFRLDADELKLLDKAWAKLEKPCQNLLKRFYYQETPLKDIAAEQQRTAATLRKQKQRCLHHLRQLFKALS